MGRPLIVHMVADPLAEALSASKRWGGDCSLFKRVDGVIVVRHRCGAEKAFGKHGEAMILTDSLLASIQIEGMQGEDTKGRCRHCGIRVPQPATMCELCRRQEA